MPYRRMRRRGYNPFSGIHIPKPKMPSTAPIKKVLLKDIFTADATSRITALRTAAMWWQDNLQSIATVMPITPDQRQSLVKAAKAFSLANGSTTEGEQEQALWTTLKIYGGIWSLPGVPNVAELRTKLDAKLPTLERQFAAANKKYADLTFALNQAFSKLGYTYVVVPSTVDRELEGTRIKLNYAAADNLRVQGLAAAVFTEAKTILKIKSLVQENGEVSIDPQAYIEATESLLDMVPDLLGAFKGSKPARPAAAASTTPAVGSCSNRATKPSPTGMPTYKPGSANRAVFDLLMDQQVHTLRECYDTALAAGAHYERDALWYVLDYGRKSGVYTVTLDKKAGTAQLVVS